MDIKKSLTRTANKVKFATKKNSPELLLGAGIVGIVATVIVACKETLAADSIIKHHQSKLIDIQEAKEIAEENPDNYEYDEGLVNHDTKVLKIQTAASLVKNYAPAVALGCFSLGCILVSRNIMSKRYLGVVTAYNGLSELFNTYRERVIQDAGKEKDLEYRYGQKFKKKTTEIINEDGTKETITEYKPEGPIDPENVTGDGSVIFDSSNPNWQTSYNLSMMFLRAQQNVATDMLHSKGHLFLNEVYDLLGLPDTAYGAVTGWIDGYGDSYVDFGIYDTEDNNRKNEDYSILLSFNHDGVMYDKI